MKNQLFATSVAATLTTPAILFSTLLLTQSQIASAETATVDDDAQPPSTHYIDVIPYQEVKMPILAP